MCVESHLLLILIIHRDLPIPTIRIESCEPLSASQSSGRGSGYTYRLVKSFSFLICMQNIHLPPCLGTSINRLVQSLLKSSLKFLVNIDKRKNSLTSLNETRSVSADTANKKMSYLPFLDTKIYNMLFCSVVLLVDTFFSQFTYSSSFIIFGHYKHVFVVPLCFT